MLIRQREAAIASLVLFFITFLVTAADPKLPARYSHWLNQDVVYIITDEERKEFLKLTSDNDRDKFMEDFWETRNPLRGSRQNPYKEEHYKRIEYTNETFGRRSNTPGWRTDMGRTYILFGKPTSRPLPVTGKFILWSFGSIRTTQNLSNGVELLSCATTIRHHARDRQHRSHAVNRARSTKQRLGLSLPNLVLQPGSQKRSTSTVSF